MSARTAPHIHGQSPPVLMPTLAVHRTATRATAADTLGLNLHRRHHQQSIRSTYDQNPQATRGNHRNAGYDTVAPDGCAWRAANYLSVGQLYLYDNPLLKRPLTLSDLKPLLVGHWGTTPGQNFIYMHLDRVINQYDLDMFYVAGPGHSGPALVANTYQEGSWSEMYPDVSQDKAGTKKLFTQFSFPGGISRHVAPTTPSSIHEGGELGFSLSHAFGAAFDSPDLIVACVIGNGEAETGPLSMTRRSGYSATAPSTTSQHTCTATAPQIVKSFLHLSKDEQAKRFRARIDAPDKNGSSASQISTNGPPGTPT